MDIIVYALAKKYAQKLMQGLGALRGSPAKIKSIAPVYSSVDPTKVVSNTITFRYEGSPGQAAAMGVPVVWEQQTVDVLNGRGIHKIQYVNNDDMWVYYNVTMLDGTIEPMKIPVNTGSMEKIIVDTLPDPAAAKDMAIYMVVEDPTKPDVYTMYMKTKEQATGQFVFTCIGSTEIDMSQYIKREQSELIKTYKNYDPITSATKPITKTPLGAINTFEKEIGGTYNDTTGKIANLNTLHNDTLVNAVNEIGYIPDLQEYDTATGKPETLVDAINLANKEYTVDKNATIDRTKYINTYKVTKNNKDGTPIAQVGQTLEIPRIDVRQQATPTSDASYVDYRTYNLYEGGELIDPYDTSVTPFGAVHIPKIQIKKKVPMDTQTRIDSISITASDWDTTVTPHTAHVILLAEPESITSIKSGSTTLTYTQDPDNARDLTITNAGTPAMTITATYEVQTMSAQYFLQIEGKDYNEILCGATIDILKNAVLKDIIIVANTADNDPVVGLLKDEKSICFVFEDAAGTQKMTYLPVKDLIKMYEGKDGIEIDDTTSATTTYVSIKLHDPDTLEALVTTDDGLRIMKAQLDQYGVIEFATQDEVKNPSATVSKGVRPIDLYTFVTASESVKDDVGTLYTDPDTGDIINNTITRAISELSTTKVEKKADTVIDEKNISEYIAKTIPVTGVNRQLGDKIEIPKSILEVTSLTGVATPKEYFLYYLTEDEGTTYRKGMYKYVKDDATWVKVGGGGIEWVTTLPTSPEEDHLYGIENNDVIVARYALSATAQNAGWKMTQTGLLDPSNNSLTWASVLASWASFVDDELVEDTNGAVTKVTHADGTSELIYGYESFEVRLWFYRDDTWYRVYDPTPITFAEIDALPEWD